MDLKKLNLKILLRFSIFLTLFFLIVFIIFSFIYNSILEKNFIINNIQLFSDITDLIESNLQKSISEEGNFQDTISKLTYIDELKKYDQLNVRITLIDGSGKVLYDNKIEPSKLETHFDRVELLKSIKLTSSYQIRYSKSLQKKLFYYSKSIFQNDKVIGFIRISKEIDEINKSKYYFFLLFFLSGLSILLVAGSLFSKSNSFWLNLLFFIKNNIENINNEKNDFPFILSNSLIISKNLQNKFEDFLVNQIKIAKNKIKTNEINSITYIFDNFSEPVFLFSNDGLCLYANSSAKNEFILENYWNIYKEKHYWEIFLENEIAESINYVIKNNKNKSFEFQKKDKTYLIEIINIKFDNMIFIIFYDITEISNYYNLRKGILSAISHELKTPLTSISGFLDHLIFEAREKNEQTIISYSEIAKRNCERLINIANDVIEIEKIDYKNEYQIETEFNNFDIIEQIKNILLLFSLKAKEKNLNLIFEPEFQNLIIRSNQYLIEQILINLIDNAIKYTEKGFVKIEIKKSVEKSAEKTESENNKFDFTSFDYLILTVEDTGIGMDESEIPKIFEPFYCVDKNRTRQKGSTGLGLTIVKSAVDKLKGTIAVKSFLSGGTKFLIKFPYIVK